jgi:hypothetical protein
VNKIFAEVGIYYAPYPELSDIIVSDLINSSVVNRSALLSRYTKTYAHHRVVKTLSNLHELGIIHQFEAGFSLRITSDQARELHALKLTQTQMRILDYIRKNGSIYYAPFFLQTRSNRTLFNKCAQFLMGKDLIVMRREAANRAGSYRHVYTFKAQTTLNSNPGALLSR